MAQRPQRHCRAPGCRALHRNANGYCEAHQSLAKAWSWQKTPGKSRPAKVWRKAPGKSGRGGRAWRRLRALVLARDGYLCQCEACRERVMPRVAHEVDHIRPLAEGGTDDLDNLRAINRDCHRVKTRQEAKDGFRRRLAKKRRGVSES